MCRPPPALAMDRAAAKLFEISVALSSPLQLDEVLKRVRVAIIEGLGFDRCGIFVLDERAGLLRGTWGTDANGELDDISGEVHPLTQTCNSLVQVALGQIPFFLTDDLEAKAWSEGLLHYPRMRGVHANACLPLMARGRIVGVLAIDNLLTDRPITVEDLEAVAPFAAQAALAVDNARLLEAAEAERRRLEAAFAEAQQRLVEATRLATIGEMSATIAHQLRDPLNVLRTNRHLLKRTIGGNSARADASLERMAEYLDRAERIINDLLAFAREGRLNPQPVCPGLLLREVAEELEIPARITTVIDDVDPLLILEADSVQLQQALRNLVRNALEAMPVGGTLTLGAAGGPDGVEILCRDSGIGMTPEQIARACDPLFTTKSDGAGLGLALVHRVAEAHRGRLTFESEPDRGTTVRLWLPPAPRAS